MNDPEALTELRAADNAYHAVCIDIQEPGVPVSELPLEDLARAAQGVLDAIARLRGTSG